METISSNSIRLRGGACHITHDASDAFRVMSGHVLVYIVPWTDGEAGRRSLLREAEEGEVIPAFAHCDLDYQHWRFCLTALEEAELAPMPGMCTRPLRSGFLRRAGVPGFEQEGFENALVNRYRMNLVREDGFLLRTDREKRAAQRQTEELIASLFGGEEEERRPGEEALYQAAAELCRWAKIDIAPYERVKACCGQGASIQDIARVSHFPCREVVLEEDWHRADAGPLLVFFGGKGEPAACIPRGSHGYLLRRNGRKAVRLTKELSEQCAPKAWAVYRPFLRSAMTGGDFARYCLRGLALPDLLAVLGLGAASGLIGLLLPVLVRTLYDQLIPLGDAGLIAQAGGLAAAFMAGNTAFSIVRGAGVFRLDSRIRYQAQSAAYHRVFELPERFFRDHESADLAGRLMEVGELAGRASGLALSLGLGAVNAVCCLLLMFACSVPLALAALGLTLAFAAVSGLIACRRMKYRERAAALEGGSDSVMYQLLRGIEKIRIAGMEDRAVYQSMKPLVERRRLETNAARLAGLSAAVSLLGGGVLSVALCALAYGMPGLSAGRFAAFICAFGGASSAIGRLTDGLVECRMLRSAYDRVKALLETPPETDGGKLLPGEVTGRIDVDHISFSYSERMPPVFSDLDLHFAPGEYVGIVGASGCGKSTLLKLLLGFERPASGRIYYDDQDMEELDLQELRKRFGVVLQDGELISGSIFDNITLTAPWAALRDAEAAAEAVGLAEDIRSMPMGFQTVVSENCNTISGGQKQRILIARALISRPKILFFDEATSALDNVTQSMVCRTLEGMEATRIVIAHRLSTIRNCGRILVLDRGRVAEEGDYAALMERRGLFYELAGRQLLESGERTGGPL